MSRYITYARHSDGYVISRMGSELAWPILEFAEIGMGGLEKYTGKIFEKGDFQGPTNFHLEKVSVYGCREWSSLTWTKKIILATKNEHRTFWGLSALREKAEDSAQTAHRSRLITDLDKCVFNLRFGLKGMPKFYQSRQIAEYLDLPPKVITLSLRAIRDAEIQ